MNTRSNEINHIFGDVFEQLANIYRPQETFKETEECERELANDEFYQGLDNPHVKLIYKHNFTTKRLQLIINKLKNEKNK